MLVSVVIAASAPAEQRVGDHHEIVNGVADVGRPEPWNDACSLINQID